MSRKVIQMLLWQDAPLVLCDDSTIWMHAGASGWERMETIPGTDDDPMFSEVEPAPAQWCPWAPSYDGIWLVDTDDENVVRAHNPRWFVLRYGMVQEGSGAWVRAEDEKDALRTWRLRNGGGVETEQLTINDVNYRYLVCNIPF